ncbi:MAG TPA: MASE1 domain-containing protein, partial [Vulgatibacter sp.]
MHRWERTLGATAALFGGCVILGLISYTGALPPLGIPAFYFPNGLAAAFLLRARRSMWPALLAASFTADVLVNTVSGFSLIVAVIWSAGDVAEILVAGWLLRLTIGKAAALARTREVVWFALVTFLLSPIVTVPFALLSVRFVPGATYPMMQASWWPTGGLGTFAVGAVAVAWSGPRWGRLRPGWIAR